MSYYAEERYAVYREDCRTARKGHTCDACNITIPKGGRYYSVTWVYDGSASGVKRCLACQFTHEHLRDLGDGEMWPDESLNCGLAYEDEWGDLPEYIGALAFWQYGDPLPPTEKCSGSRLWYDQNHPYPFVTDPAHHWRRGTGKCHDGLWTSKRGEEICA